MKNLRICPGDQANTASLSRKQAFHKSGQKTVIIPSYLSSSSSSVICQMTGPKPLPKRFLHIARPRASSFNWQYPLLYLRSSSSFLRLLPRLLVTSICTFMFPSITCCRRQFLRKMWPMQLAFRFLISCRIFLCSLTLSNTSSLLTWICFLMIQKLLQSEYGHSCTNDGRVFF